MASWAAVLALTGFQYSGVDKTMTFAPQAGTYFWSNGYAWGTCSLKKNRRGTNVRLSVLQGRLTLSQFSLRDYGSMPFAEPLTIPAGSQAEFTVTRAKADGA
jgi:non-lysosomal glucosylceramidase